MKLPKFWVFLSFFTFIFFFGWLKKNEIRKIWLEAKIESRRTSLEPKFEVKNDINLLIGNSLVVDSCLSSPNHKFLKMGFSGELISGIECQLFDLTFRDVHIKNLIIFIGLNNVLNGYSLEEIKTQYLKLFEKLPSKANRVTVIQLPEINLPHEGFFVKSKPSNDLISKVNSFLKDQCKRFEFNFLEISTIQKITKIHQPDGVHLNCDFSSIIAVKIDSSIVD